jgi:hypothetical protein
MEEEDPTFPDCLRLLPTQPANNSSPKQEKQPKTNPSQNANASLLLLLKTKQLFSKLQHIW